MPKRMLSLLRNLFRKRAVEQALDDELRSSVEVLAQEKMAQGLSQSAARREALMEIGGIEQVKEEVREVRAGRILEDFARDIRFAFRTLAKSPGFTAVAVITLALGIGANTAIFSTVNGVLLNPLPYAQPEQLVALYSRTAEFSRGATSYPNFLDWTRDNRSFSSLAAYRPYDYDLTGTGEPERVPAEMVSATFYSTLGVKPVIGRLFDGQDDRLGAAPVALISSGLWARKFGSSPRVLGSQLTLNGVGYTVVGVIPSTFYYIGGNFHRSDVYVPIGQCDDPQFRDRRTSMGMDVVGRLEPGITLAQARDNMGALARHLAEQYPEVDKDTDITMVPLKQDVVGDVRPYLLVLLAAVGFVLLIACVNVANLLLVRSTSRAREFAIRMALGAARSRLVCQLLTESILLALAGGAIGLLTASWGLGAALSLLPEALPRAQDVHLDTHVLLFTLAVSILAGTLFGLSPAVKAADGNIQETLKEGGRGSDHTHHRLQSVFSVGEVALTFILLAGAGLMIRSLTSLWHVDPGFDPHHVLSFHISFPLGNESPGGIRETLHRIQNRLEDVPGVQAVALSAGSRPMRNYSEVPFWLAGRPKPSAQTKMSWARFYLVQQGYLEVMRTPLKRGRFFIAADSEHSPVVTVIDQRFAQIYFHGENPIGKRINFGILNMTAEIVGVVAHVTQSGPGSDSTLQAQCYLALPQLPDSLISTFRGDAAILLRTTGSPAPLVGAIRGVVHQINSQAVMYDTETMESIISDSLAVRRLLMILLGIFAVSALIMSCIGIYGVVSYATRQRTREIGVRMALGAERWGVLGMVIGQGLKLALVGVAIGTAGALGLTRFLTSLLYGVKPTDPLTFVAVTLTLISVALVASYIPARRATKVDPMVALRYE